MRFLVLLCLGMCVSPGADPPVKSDDRLTLVNEGLVDAWLKTWQTRMRLGDWRIGVRIVHPTELKPDTLGNLKWNSADRTAIIKVLDPADYDLPVGEIPHDIEYTIVHELVHLQLSVLPRDLNKKDVEEAVVNRFADALMSLDKGPGFRASSAPPPKSTGKPAEPEIAGRVAQP